MVSINERVAYLEGQAGAQVGAIDGLRGQIGELRVEVTDLRGDLRRDVAGLRGELHRDVAGLRGELHRDVAGLRGALGDWRSDVDRRFDRIEDTFDRRFAWLVGMQVATLLGVIAALAAPYFS